MKDPEKAVLLIQWDTKTDPEKIKVQHNPTELSFSKSSQIAEIAIPGRDIGQILDMRNFMDSLRSNGVETGGPSVFGQREQLKFANELDKFIARL